VVVIKVIRREEPNMVKKKYTKPTSKFPIAYMTMAELHAQDVLADAKLLFWFLRKIFPDKKGYHSLNNLAKKFNKKTRTIQRWIDNLRKAGWIKTVVVAGDYHGVNFYIQDTDTLYPDFTLDDTRKDGWSMPEEPVSPMTEMSYLPAHERHDPCDTDDSTPMTEMSPPIRTDINKQIKKTDLHNTSGEEVRPTRLSEEKGRATRQERESFAHTPLQSETERLLELYKGLMQENFPDYRFEKKDLENLILLQDMYDNEKIAEMIKWVTLLRNWEGLKSYMESRSAPIVSLEPTFGVIKGYRSFIIKGMNGKGLGNDRDGSSTSHRGNVDWEIEATKGEDSGWT